LQIKRSGALYIAKDDRNTCEEAEKKKKARSGKPNSLPMEERLLMSLEYLREYRG
jgi:hypothetical protein